MKDLLDLILKHITTHPDDALVEEGDDNGVTSYTITVNPEDMGRVIGKDGKVIRAIRSLAHVIAVRQGKRFRIKLADEEGSGPDIQGEPAIATNEEPKETEDLIAGAIEVSPTAETVKPVKAKSTK